MLRAAPDYTVFVSGIAKGGPGASKLFDAWISGRFELITSESILQEANRTLVVEGASEVAKDESC